MLDTEIIIKIKAMVQYNRCDITRFKLCQLCDVLLVEHARSSGNIEEMYFCTQASC